MTITLDYHTDLLQSDRNIGTIRNIGIAVQGAERTAHVRVLLAAQAINVLSVQACPDDVLVLLQAVRALVGRNGNWHQEIWRSVTDELLGIQFTLIDQIEGDAADAAAEREYKS